MSEKDIQIAILVDGIKCYECRVCGRVLPLGLFCKTKKNTLGIWARCKSCYNQLRKEQKREHPGTVAIANAAIRSKVRRRKHPHEGIFHKRGWAERNREHVRAINRMKPKHVPNKAPEAGAAHSKMRAMIKSGEVVRASECEVCGNLPDTTTLNTPLVACYDSYDLDRLTSLPWLCRPCRCQFNADRKAQVRGTVAHGYTPNVGTHSLIPAGAHLDPNPPTPHTSPHHPG